MTCQELNLRLDELVRTGGGGSESVNSHLSVCPDCRRLFDERMELATSLTLVREAAPLASEQLDAKVLVNYRQFIADRTNAPKGIVSRPRILAWAAFAAAASLLVAVLFEMRPPRTIATPTQPPVPQTVATTSVAKETVNSAQVQARGTVQARRISKPRHHSAAPDSSRAANEVTRSLPDDFRRLMYCDELSCAQDMDVIRVQLPTAFTVRSGRPLPQPGGLINAEVLVGPDGIARGIRFEQ